MACVQFEGESETEIGHVPGFFSSLYGISDDAEVIFIKVVSYIQVRTSFLHGFIVYNTILNQS